MFSNEARSICAALGELAGKIPDEDFAIVRMARQNLSALAEQLEEAEKAGVMPAAAEGAVNG